MKTVKVKSAVIAAMVTDGECIVRYPLMHTTPGKLLLSEVVFLEKPDGTGAIMATVVEKTKIDNSPNPANNGIEVKYVKRNVGMA